MRAALLLTLIFSLFLAEITFAQSVIPGFVLNNRVGIQVSEPEDVAVDSHGNIYFVEGTVKRFHYHEFLGTEDLSYAPDGLNRENYGTYDIALDQHDNLFIVSYTYSKVAKFSPEGRLMLEFGTVGDTPGQFRFPDGIAVNSKDEIYVADSGNRRIQRFDKTGRLLQIIPLDPSTDNYLDAPLSIDFDGDDNLYLLHNPENKVVKYSPAGEKLIEFGNEPFDSSKLDNPWKLAVNKVTGEVFVSDETFKASNIYTSDGSLEYSIKWVSNYQHPKGYKNSIAVTPLGEIILADRGHQGSGQISIYDRGNTGLYKWGNLWQNVDLSIDEVGNVYLLDVSGTITKFNALGEFVMTYGEKGVWRAGLPNLVIKAPKAITSDIYSNLYALGNPGLDDNTTAIYKLDQRGNILSVFTEIGPNTETSTYTDLAVDAAGTMYVADQSGGLIHKINSGGKQLGTIGSPGFGPGELWMPVAIAIDKAGVLHVLDYNGGRIQQFDSRGNLIRQFGKFSKQDGSIDSNSDIALDSKGNIHVASNLGQRRYWVFSPKGDLLHEVLDSKINHIAIDQLGANLVLDDDQADGYSHYIANVYENPQSMIKGVVFNDVNNNCIFDEGERTLSGIVVMTSPGPYYAITDANGGYTLTVTPDKYTLHTILPQQEGRTITATCPLPEKGYPVTVTDPGQLIQHINFGNYLYAPAHLSVSVSSTRRRRCFESTTKLTYSNTGFAPAQNAKVYLQLPEQVELLSADKAYTRLPDGTYVFEAGTVAPGQTSVITIQDKVICGDESIRGRTVCTRAWITPGNQSPTVPPTAVSAVLGRCDAATGYVRFVIRNTGQTDMETGEQFRIYQDGKLATVENYTLAAGDSMVFRVPAMGRTVRLEADQPDGNGDNTLASATVEACRVGGSPTAFSTGFVNAMPTDDEEAEVAEECLPIIDSYDPNDKLVMPKGLTEEHYTPTGAALKYKVRFQNTGTDVAYRVVVVDTLSEHLDPSTLQIGSASHDYTYELNGKGRPVLTWTFHNIMLPDSTTNEPGSHGYIQFSIKPNADLAEKTAVENFADIFFDYNSPVRTNITVNRIYDMPLEIQEENRIVADEVVMTPTITAFSPAAGKYGTEVVVTGLKFSNEPEQNKVYVNGVRAEVLEGDATTLKVRVPKGASTGTISVVTEHAGASSKGAFTVYQPPVIAGFSPAEGVVGAEVTLQGEHLSADLTERVQLGSLDCEVVSTGQSTVRVRVPANAVTGAFTVHTKGGAVQSEAAYRVWYAPVLTGFDKAMQRVGGRLLLHGENFAPEPNRNTVLFGHAQAEVLQATAQTLEVRVPAGARTGTVSVTTPGGTASRAFEVIPAPVITAVYPAKGSVGTVVELKGERFLTLGIQDTVLFSGVEAIVLSSSSTLFQVRVPRGAESGKVVVAGIGGSDEADFEVEQLTPSQSVDVFPNPSTGRFTVDFTKADFDVQGVQVYDTTGKLLYNEKLTAGQSERMEINLSGEKAGVFLVMVLTEQGKVVKKVTLL